ncbi:unnamed protein product [Adineta ricciae]|uniref:Glucose-methanol-choline oxidoreductase N-terminal domain-containing protein n=1 Tax=Adineta ricciae TaxID=249248 RepID=A0A815VWB2_ADIRI|nr:unnamed protein product [Adineta ricciae]CAF1533285.1 unnamed protein product [Adineta ricciae]
MASCNRKVEADFVIIGGGTAGCVIATRLAEYGFETLLISSGLNDTENPLMKQSSLYRQVSQSPQFKHYLVPDASCSLNNTSVDITVINTLGGSSINGGGMERMTANEWNSFVHATGDESFDCRMMSKYYKMTENYTTNDPSFIAENHGHNGPIKITKPYNFEFYNVWESVAREIGETFSNDFVDGLDYGFSFEASSFTNGERSWSGNAYLVPALAKYSNLKIITGATVIKLDVDEETKQIKNVVFISCDDLFSATARKEYILSAGTFYSPHLLMLSGVGDPDTLQQHRIPIKHELRQVGKNLMDNGAVVIEYKSTNLSFESCKPMALINSQSLTTDTNPDIFFFLQPNEKTKHVDAVIFNASPKSTIGSVSLYNSNPLILPKITLNYLKDQNDVATFINGIKYVQRIMSTGTIMSYLQLTEIPPITKEMDLPTYVRNKLMGAAHFVGTCSMGRNAQNSVVDNYFKVHGMGNLRIVDGSVFPAGLASKTGPCHTIYALAEKAADLIRQEYSSNNL